MRLPVYISLIIFYFSCQSISDLTNPSFETFFDEQNKSKVEICNEEVQDGLLFFGGQTIRFYIMCKDDNNLSQLKIDVHNNFDCHGHSSSLAPNINVPSIQNRTLDFNFQKIYNLNGIEQKVEVILEIPANVTAGFYHLGIYLIDEYGNEAPSVFYDVKIINPLDTIPPDLQVSSTNHSVNIARGQLLTIGGKVTDNSIFSLGGNSLVFLNYNQVGSPNTYGTNAFEYFGNINENTRNFELNYTIPMTIIKGNYEFSVYAFDGVRNIARPYQFKLIID